MTAAVAGAKTTEQQIIAATEIFPDGRVMVFQFLRVGDRYTAQMMIYEDATLIRGERVLYISTMENQYEGK